MNQYMTARRLIQSLLNDPILDLDAPLEAELVRGSIVIYARRKRTPVRPVAKKKKRPGVKKRA